MAHELAVDLVEGGAQYAARDASRRVASLTFEDVHYPPDVIDPALRGAFISQQGLRWVMDVDIRKYYDTVEHTDLRTFLDHRVTDGLVRRMID